MKVNGCVDRTISIKDTQGKCLWKRNYLSPLQGCAAFQFRQKHILNSQNPACKTRLDHKPTHCELIRLNRHLWWCHSWVYTKITWQVTINSLPSLWIQSIITNSAVALSSAGHFRIFQLIVLVLEPNNACNSVLPL